MVTVGRIHTPSSCQAPLTRRVSPLPIASGIPRLRRMPVLSRAALCGLILWVSAAGATRLQWAAIDQDTQVRPRLRRANHHWQRTVLRDKRHMLDGAFVRIRWHLTSRRHSTQDQKSKRHLSHVSTSIPPPPPPHIHRWIWRMSWGLPRNPCRAPVSSPTTLPGITGGTGWGVRRRGISRRRPTPRATASAATSARACVSRGRTGIRASGTAAGEWSFPGFRPLMPTTAADCVLRRVTLPLPLPRHRLSAYPRSVSSSTPTPPPALLNSSRYICTGYVSHLGQQVMAPTPLPKPVFQIKLAHRQTLIHAHEAPADHDIS
jgi:hypothetical protein